MGWLGIVAIIVGVPIVGLVGLALAGLFIAKGHRATRSVAYTADADTLWRVVTDWPAHPQWRPRVKVIERLPDRNGHEVWREIRRNGSRLTSEVISLDAEQRRMVAKIVDERAFGGTWSWDVAPREHGSGAMLTIVEEGEVYNPIFRAIGTWLLDPRATIDRLHYDLKAKLGEPPPALDGTARQVGSESGWSG